MWSPVDCIESAVIAELKASLLSCVVRLKNASGRSLVFVLLLDRRPCLDVVQELEGPLVLRHVFEIVRNEFTFHWRIRRLENVSVRIYRSRSVSYPVLQDKICSVCWARSDISALEKLVVLG
jgi:hypothetical protein